jgi:hypothetical protein
MPAQAKNGDNCRMLRRPAPVIQAHAADFLGDKTAGLPGRASHLLWDIFCQVIDNYGDIGVCWRLAAQLAKRGHSVRLWLDDKRALQWMAPGAAQGDWPDISVHDWPVTNPAASSPALPLADVWIEAFGCDIPLVWLQTQVQAANTQARRPVWINLEYLSAEPFALRSHGLPSPVLQGPAKGWTKFFFYPGFSKGSGGLLRGAIAQAGAASWAEPELTAFAPAASGERTVLLFTYANAPIAALLQALHRSAQPVQVLVAAGQSADAVRLALAALPSTVGAFEVASPGRVNRSTFISGDIPRAATQSTTAALEEWQWGPLRLRFLPFIPQSTFDQLLGLCDLNLVRGEDSLAQAVQAGKPCVWQIYAQDDGAHGTKLQAYLEAIAADTPLRAWHSFWNSTPTAAQAEPGLTWPWEPDSTWQQNADALATQLAQNKDLCSQLIDWAVQRGTKPTSG